MHALTKSDYTAGLSCIRMLWYKKNAKDKIPAVEPSAQARMDVGIEVGKLAHGFFPNGVEVPYGRDAITRTKALMKKRIPIFEATFVNDGGYCRVDVLLPVGKDDWDVIEVKSTTSVKPEHLDDVAFQRWCIEGAGVHVRKTFLMHIDNTYFRQGKLDLKKFLTAEDITDDVTAKLLEVPVNVERLLKIVNGPKPKVQYGIDCEDPLECPVCAPDLDDADITELYWFGKRSYPLLNQGIRHLKDLPKGTKLNDKQKIQIQAFLTKKVHANKEAIKAWLKTLKEPLHFLDFETLGPAIPLYDGTRPFDRIPFQFSLHILRNGSVEHVEFLADGKDDPRPAVVEAMKAIGPKGAVLTYTDFEKGCLENLAEAVPQESKWLHSIIGRLVDLNEPFANFDFYHPDQHGSTSIKELLPAVTTVSYDDLKIQDGSLAPVEFLRVTFTNVTDEERKKVRNALLAYCKRDTEAMVAILDVLATAVNK